MVSDSTARAGDEQGTRTHRASPVHMPSSTEERQMAQSLLAIESGSTESGRTESGRTEPVQRSAEPS